MFASSKNAVTSAKCAVRNYNILSAKGGRTLSDPSTGGRHQFKTSTIRPNYAAVAHMPLPDNIDASESTHFSPQRSRDITANVMNSQHASISAWRPEIDITADNTMTSNATLTPYRGSYDPHVQSYDCFGAVSLNSAMQSNVPEPYGGMRGFSHLNMPGGQWSQEGKFTSQDLQSSHYQELRHKARSDWDSYNANATISQKACSIGSHHLLNNAKASMRFSHNINAIGNSKNLLNPQILETVINRFLCSKSESKDIPKEDLSKDTPKVELSKKEKLKRAFKEYGATIVVFHVAISLVSLGGFYALVSGGIDMMPILEYLGLTSTALSNKIATGASTFVVAYAVHKVFAPVRISITLGSAPFIVRYLRSKGLLKAKIVRQK